MQIDGVECDYEECAVALDRSLIWANGVKYVPQAHERDVGDALRAARSFIEAQEPPNIRMAVEKLLEAVTAMHNK